MFFSLKKMGTLIMCLAWRAQVGRDSAKSALKAQTMIKSGDVDARIPWFSRFKNLEENPEFHIERGLGKS